MNTFLIIWFILFFTLDFIAHGFADRDFVTFVIMFVSCVVTMMLFAIVELIRLVI